VEEGNDHGRRLSDTYPVEAFTDEVIAEIASAMANVA
jgi:hypothetical protein